MVAIGHADHVIDLDLAAGAHAQPALNAGIQVDAHRRMAGVAVPALGGRKPAFGHFDLLGPAARISSSGSCEVARAGWSATSNSITIFCAQIARARWPTSPSCRQWAAACRTPPAPAHLRPRPCRHGNCRRAGSPAPAYSTDAEFRGPGVWRLARWSRLHWPRPACRRVRTEFLVIPQLPWAGTLPGSI